MITLAAFCGTLGRYSANNFNKEPIKELKENVVIEIWQMAKNGAS